MQAITLMRALITAAAALATAVAVSGPAAGAAAAARTGPAVLAFRPARFDYGKVRVGQHWAETFTLANTGGRASGALRVTLSGPAAFAITADTCRASLPPGRKCTVRVRFAPAATGTVTATLRAVSHKHRKRAVLAADRLTGTGKGLGASGHLYWTADDGTAIDVANLDGSGVTTLVSGQDSPWGLAVDGSHLYWTNQDSGPIEEAPLAGGAATTLIPAQPSELGGIAVDSSHVYWADLDLGTNGTDGTINQASLPDGSNPQALITKQQIPSGVAVGP